MHGGYVKLENYLLQLLCHLTSNVKHLHMLNILWIKLGLFNKY